MRYTSEIKLPENTFQAKAKSKVFRRHQVILVKFKLHEIFYRIFAWLISGK